MERSCEGRISSVTEAFCCPSLGMSFGGGNVVTLSVRPGVGSRMVAGGVSAWRGDQDCEVFAEGSLANIEIVNRDESGPLTSRTEFLSTEFGQ